MDKLEDLSRDELISRVLGLSQEVTSLNQKLQDMDVKLKEQILSARQMSVEQQKQAEEEEEYITNTFLKKLEVLKHEQNEVMLRVEAEEEYLTNTLQKKLDTLQGDKIDLENRLEQEEEFIVNKLQQKLQQLLEEKNQLEDQIEGNYEVQISVANQRLSKMVASEKQYKEQIKELQHKNFVLEQQLKEAQEELKNNASIQCELEQQAEVSQEQQFHQGILTPPRRGSGSLTLVKPPRHTAGNSVSEEWVTIIYEQREVINDPVRAFVILFDNGLLQVFEDENHWKLGSEPDIDILLDVVKQVDQKEDSVVLQLLSETYKLFFPDSNIAKNWYSMLKDFVQP